MGEQLDLIRVSRTEMGAYLCIAQNSVPPSISKRIILNVECKLQSLYHSKIYTLVLIDEYIILRMKICSKTFQSHLYITTIWYNKI